MMTTDSALSSLMAVKLTLCLSLFGLSTTATTFLMKVAGTESDSKVSRRVMGRSLRF